MEALPYLTAATAVAGVASSMQATAAQKKANAASQRMASLQSHQERVKAVREARIQRARLLANPTLGEGTAGVEGATSSIASQLGANIGFQNVMEEEGTIFNQARNAAANASSNASMWQGISGMAQQWGGPEMWKTFWQSGTKPTDITGRQVATAGSGK
jgi:hypothetical protein